MSPSLERHKASRPANSLGPDGKTHSFYASGSGFSEYFPRPSYQDNVVPQYVKSLKGEHKGLFNPAKSSKLAFNLPLHSYEKKPS
jgi:hypothetical protein